MSFTPSSASELLLAPTQDQEALHVDFVWLQDDRSKPSIVDRDAGDHALVDAGVGMGLLGLR